MLVMTSCYGKIDIGEDGDGGDRDYEGRGSFILKTEWLN